MRKNGISSEESTSQLVAFLARVSVSPASEKDLKEPLDLFGNTSDFYLKSDPVGWFMRTCPECSLVREEGTSPQSSRGLPDGMSPSRRADGETPESAETCGGGTDWRGECLTLNIREFPDFPGRFPSGDGASSSSDTVASLSEVLWTGPIPLRYYLTERACRGILRRAERRGKKLPEILETALKRQAEAMAKMGNAGGGDGVVLDLQGGKTSARFTEDGSCPTITRGKGSASDVHSVVETTNSNGGDVMPTLTSGDLVKQVTGEADCGGGICWSVGNGQINEAQVNLKECCQTLNCMHDQQRILIENEDDLH